MAFRDILNNYYYGKQGKADMTVADLPATRPELFFTVLKVRFTSLIGVNLLYLVAWLPAILWTAVNVMLLNSLLNGLGPSQPDAMNAAGLWLLILAPCVAITGPFNAGVTFVLRNWARDQHSFVLSDFWDAVKGNWRQALAVSAISGALPFLCFTGMRFYSGMAAQSPVFMLPVALLGLVGALWSMMTMVIYDMMVTYALKLRHIIRNALLLTLGKLPFALLFKLLTLIIPLLAVGVALLIPGATSGAMLALCLLYLIIVPAFNKLLTVSYANWLCETYLNSRIEGAQTNIGLRPENWDDTEYRPEDDEV